MSTDEEQTVSFGPQVEPWRSASVGSVAALLNLSGLGAGYLYPLRWRWAAIHWIGLAVWVVFASSSWV